MTHHLRTPIRSLALLGLIVFAVPGMRVYLSAQGSAKADNRHNSFSSPTAELSISGLEGGSGSALGAGGRDGVERCSQPLSMLALQNALEPIVRETCRRSPTFRRQLLRLADAPGLVVTIAIVRLRTSDQVAAKTQFEREQGLVRRAGVEISDAKLERLVELIAHELEHVIEQLDDVNLALLAEGPGVSSNDHTRGRSFETMRARQIGLEVAAQFQAGSVAADKERLVP